MSSDGEQTIATTAFGTVTDRRIKYLVNKSWFGGGSEEDIPLRHVTSVRLETNRHPILAVILGLIGLGLLIAAKPATILIGIVLLALVVLLLWGSPRVVVNTAGGDLRRSSGFPWVKPEANNFVQALRTQLFKE